MKAMSRSSPHVAYSTRAFTKLLPVRERKIVSKIFFILKTKLDSSLAVRRSAICYEKIHSITIQVYAHVNKTYYLPVNIVGCSRTPEEVSIKAVQINRQNPTQFMFIDVFTINI